MRTEPGTQKIYRESVTRITRHIGTVQLAKLTPQHVQHLLRALGEERTDDGTAHYKPATIQRAREVLRNALNVAVAWDLIPRNVEILGHSSIAVTMNIYTHVLDESKRDAQRCSTWCSAPTVSAPKYP